MQEIIARLSDVAKVEVPPRTVVRRMTMILAPDRAKIEQLKHREASAAGKTKPAADGAAPAKAAVEEPQEVEEPAAQSG